MIAITQVQADLVRLILLDEHGGLVMVLARLALRPAVVDVVEPVEGRTERDKTVTSGSIQTSGG
jgi:hypothetical protein